MELSEPTLVASVNRHWFTVDVKVQGFLTIGADGRKSYTKGFTRNLVVDSESFSLDFLMRSLRSDVNWGENQTAQVWFFDRMLGEDANLADDSQMGRLFDMYKSDSHFELTVSVHDKLVVAQNDLISLEPSTQLTETCPPTDKGQTTPASEVAASEEAAADESDEVLPDVFDAEEEYVGVNDEHIYLPQTQPEQPAQPTETTHTAQPDEPEQPAQSTEPDAEGVVPPDIPVTDADPQVLNVLHDPENPDIRKGALFPDIVTFRKAIRHYAVKRGFEFAGMKTDKKRFIARCGHEGCPWRIHASRLQDDQTIQIKVLPFEHNCPTTKLQVGKMATQGWVADRLGDWIKKNPKKGPKAAQENLEEKYEIKLKYSKAWAGMRLALDQIHGKYEESFQLLFNWKAEIEKKSPGSIVEVEVQKVGKKMCFRRIFVAFKPCVDGFLAGCRPYIGVDSTKLTGKYTGQLASATSVDGHNWLFYVAYAVFDSETEENWVWFMKMLQRAIGCPPGLVISTDACKGLETAVNVAFPSAEHRECMRHLYANFMKKYRGPIFTQHLYPAARSYTEDKFKWHRRQGDLPCGLVRCLPPLLAPAADAADAAAAAADSAAGSGGERTGRANGSNRTHPFLLDGPGAFSTIRKYGGLRVGPEAPGA